MSELKKVLITLPDHLLREVDEIVALENMNRSEFVRQAMKLYIGQRHRMEIKEQLMRGYGQMADINRDWAEVGMEAEERGQGEAIARNLYEMSGLKVPVLCIMIGEGGSGGALALSVGNEVWMLENATYSILSPEGFASILWKDGRRAKEASGVMKITAQDLKALGVIEEIIPEYGMADQPALISISRYMKRHIKTFLKKQNGKTGDC